MMSGLVCGAECPGTLLPKLPTMIGIPEGSSLLKTHFFIEFATTEAGTGVRRLNGVRGFPTIPFFQDLHPPVWRIFYTIFSSIVFTLLAVTFQLIKLHSNAHDGSSLLKTHTANVGQSNIIVWFPFMYSQK
jgi:hypothetical protein